LFILTYYIVRLKSNKNLSILGMTKIDFKSYIIKNKKYYKIIQIKEKVITVLLKTKI